ncbi:MAG: hypothetical protein ABI178_01490 [Rhodanobacter sp.]
MNHTVDQHRTWKNSRFSPVVWDLASLTGRLLEETIRAAGSILLTAARHRHRPALALGDCQSTGPTE